MYLLEPIVNFQELITTEFLHNFPILSFLLLFSSGHPINGGQTFIGNLLQSIVKCKNLSRHNFSVISQFLVFCSCSSIDIQIMVVRPSSLIYYRQLWPFKNLTHLNFPVISRFLVFCSCSPLGIQILVVRSS